MYQSESIHKYPRTLTAAIEGLCIVLVVLTSARIGFFFLRAFWDSYGQNEGLIAQIPLFPSLVAWIAAGKSGYDLSIVNLWSSIMAPLVWSAIALFATIVLRNAFPAVRTSPQGMLVEFAGSWLPIPWENVISLRVTSDSGGEHFVLLAQTSKGYLTVWHRIYSFFYGLNRSPGFYITSNISDFEPLIQTILSESERTARASETARPIRLDEAQPSLFFRLLLSPGSPFSRRANSDTSAEPAATPLPLSRGGPVAATYPSQITNLIKGAVIALAVLTVLHYLACWSRFLALELPALRPIPPFSWNSNDSRYVELWNAYRSQGAPFLGIPERPDLPTPWWIIVSAHLSLVLAIATINWLRNLLPALESRNNGLAIHDAIRQRWIVLPWKRLRALKLTEISEQSQILLVQGEPLPAWQRLTSWLYDGSFERGVLITSAISNFQPMLEHALGQITTLEANNPSSALRQEAHSPLLAMAFGGRAARQTLVGGARADATTRTIQPNALLPAARTMALLALAPALLAGFGGLLSDHPPTLRLLIGVIALWIFGMLEWPLVCLISVLLDDNTGGGEEGYRVLYLYPASQLPRLLPLIAAIILQIVGIALLPTLAWVGAIVWAFWLGRGIWEELYEWQGSQAILGGLLPIFWQLLLLLGYIIIIR